MSKSNVSVNVTLNGRTVSLVATPKQYAPNDKSNGEVRHGFYCGGKVVLDLQNESDKMLVTIDGQDNLVTGRFSANQNWLYNVCKKQVIDGKNYQVGFNVTACKMPGKVPSGLHEFQVGCNITPIFKSEKAPKGKGGKKATAAAKTNAPTTTVSNMSDLDKLLASLNV